MSDEAMTKLFQCPHCEGEGSFDAATGQVDNDTGTQFTEPVRCGHCQGIGLAYGIVVHRLTELARAADDDDAYLVMLIQDACAIIELQARKLAKQRRAQSAGEALDPAGTGEGVEMSQSASGMVAWLHRTCKAKKLNKTYGCDNFHCVYCRAARQIIGDASDLRAQASALAEARRSALEEAAKVCDRFNGYMAQLAAKAIRALTEPQHGNG